MVSHVETFAFSGITTIPVDVQVQVSRGLVAFHIVGLPDKAVGESRERVRSALHAMGLSLPAKRITVNLSPANLTKEGSHYDLPIALGLLMSMGVIDPLVLDRYVALGELSLDGILIPVPGILPSAVGAYALNKGIICPKQCGAEARWSGNDDILAPKNLQELLSHLKGQSILPTPELKPPSSVDDFLDFADIKGQETAKRVLEITACGGHNLLMSGPPGAGKSMLAARLPGILPPMNGREILEVSMIRSISGLLTNGGVSTKRPFRDPHHSSSMPALIGGGMRAKPGEVSLAHNGILFLDEFPEFSRAALEALRQPLETGQAVIARANAHVRYPARFQLIAAMNPCRCGHLDDTELACTRAPVCAQDYQNKISGPMMDRIDLHIDVMAVSPADLVAPRTGETSQTIAKRVQKVRDIQEKRFQKILSKKETILVNAHAEGKVLDAIAPIEKEAQAFLMKAAKTVKLSARGYHRVLKVARTIADMEGVNVLQKTHVAESLSYRRTPSRRGA